RVELKDKLRAIIIGMGIEAGELTGIRNKLNIQVYILTEFWDSIKEANPVIFTFLRDGVPFYDRGIFMPWKQLLKMGKIKPSMEAIEMYMTSGEQMLDRVRYKIKEIGMEDIFYALLTPSQAALMLYGLPPPTPKETPDLMEDVFVKKEQLLEKKYVDILRKTIQTRKALEHGTKEKISGNELDELLVQGEEYLKRIKKLFEEIERVKEKETITNIFDTMVTITRDLLKSENISSVSEEELLSVFKKEIASKGLVPEKYTRLLTDFFEFKASISKGKALTKSEIDDMKKKSREYIKFVIEYLQRKQSKDLDRARIRFTYGTKIGELLLYDQQAFLLLSENEERKIYSAKLKDGGLHDLKEISLEMYEKALAKPQLPQKIIINHALMNSLKKFIGQDVDIILS
ncbi:MAG: hypothetical protein QW594_01015, partial [Candidatus Woesearchaeota archaeon]